VNATPEPEVVLQSGAPIGRQVHAQIRACILSGRLRPGDQLPTVRQAAVELAVNPRAMQRIYARLEQDGFLCTEDGSGVFVAPPKVVRRAAERRQARLQKLCGRFLAWAERQGYAANEVIGILSHFAPGVNSHGRES
jgi:GntR family transcriptional regulator